MCSGQTPASAATASTPREGETALQLAPSFLDRMPACPKRDSAPPLALVQASAGSVTPTGDCAWSNGVKCHFHLGAEFVDSSGPRPNVGELHCIFPTDESKSPRVYGTHFTCRSGSAVSHRLQQEHACGASLLSTLSATMGHCDARCCDAGTLTDPLDEREDAGTLDIRPSFRICAATVELDCSMFAGMIGREANAPRFGLPVVTRL
jgi:hypothetical protein